MPRTPESIREAALKARSSVDAQLKRTEPQKLISREARDILLSAREDNDAGKAALERMKKLKTIPGFFPTPNNLVSTLIRRAMDLKVKRGDHIDMEELRVLEPSAGKGDIATMVQGLGGSVDCVEINHELREILTKEKKLNVVAHDFMSWAAEPAYDMVLMNPPFENHQDRAHIRHAFDFLKPGGVLVAIASAGCLNECSTGRGFRLWLGLDGKPAADKEMFVWNIEDGAFAGPESERLTNVRTVMIRIIKLPKTKGFPYGRLS